MAFLRFLAKPFPIIDGNRKKFTMAFAFGAFVFVFLYIFYPFGLVKFTDRQLLLSTLGFGSITFTIMFINLLFLSKLFPGFFKEERWTVGKEIFITLFYIAVIGLGNYLFATKVLTTKATFNNLLYVEFISLCLAIFPVVVWTLIRENMLLKQNRKEAEKFIKVLSRVQSAANGELMHVKTEPSKPVLSQTPFVVFTSENETTTIEAETDKIYFISSADNYIRIYLVEENTIVTKLLRSSLKRTEEDLKNHSQFYRCHRAYIVNLQKVGSVTGNARGLKLTLKNCGDEVPVSRSLNEEIRQKLKQIHSH